MLIHVRYSREQVARLLFLVTWGIVCLIVLFQGFTRRDAYLLALGGIALTTLCQNATNWELDDIWDEIEEIEKVMRDELVERSS